MQSLPGSANKQFASGSRPRTQLNSQLTNITTMNIRDLINEIGGENPDREIYIANPDATILKLQSVSLSTDSKGQPILVIIPEPKPKQ